MASKRDLCCQTGFSWPLVIIWFPAVFALWNHPCCPRVSVQWALNLSVKAWLHPRQVANLSTIYQPTNNHLHLHSLLKPIKTLFWDSSRPALKSFLIKLFLIAYSNINLCFVNLFSVMEGINWPIPLLPLYIETTWCSYLAWVLYPLLQQWCRVLWKMQFLAIQHFAAARRAIFLPQ